MERRPDFNEIKTFEEFSKFYWYRDELKQICKEHGIDSSGMKTELNRNIEEYFNGKIIAPKKKCGTNQRKKIKDEAELSLQSSLVECGFCFSQRFRDFFSEQTGVKKFKFNVDMVATAKKVKETGDSSFTLGDLLDIYYGKKVYEKYDAISLQWNKFVKDFCADKDSSAFPNKLKTASILWKEVRNSTREKIYTHDLLSEFADKIKGEAYGI
ncbi:MAG: SAP domain-containing protein [Treponema sp.]|nr:SAP domain-containing protein [Treponema sp.]